MAIDKARATVQLKAFDFTKLFIEELGWDRPASRQSETVGADGQDYTLVPVADKRGVRILHCTDIPDRNTRQRIEREITKRVYEHLIIFTDSGQTKQIWQWVAREKGKPAAFREHLWLAATAPDALIQKLDHIAFTLSEEEGLTLAGTTLRMRDAFDREKITKRFYEDFKRQHDRFLTFIDGLASVSDRQWYASLMLNRLMFVYFIQKKRFLDGDIDYLKNRLDQVRAAKGTDQFHSFYRAFLLKLFHGGLATAVNFRDPETAKLLGSIPYLNGGLFEPHALESEGHTIQIADAAFEGVFAFFDQYEWTLDTRPIEEADGKEINPDVLGHIFEKYINQKQMGAYYTKEDITDYITKNTVVPWLFQNAITHDKVAFEPDGYVWRLLSENPDDYIYKSVSQGTESPLPENIAAGITDVAKRTEWNKTAPREFGLPTEIWREVVARRERYAAIRAKAESGEITRIEDFITHNLDIRQFARDVIQYAESPDLVRAFWKAISSIKILDPACGSGAFLFAALNIQYDLYDACLERMEQFVVSATDSGGGRGQLYSDFHTVLAQVAQHPNRDYFIYKSIIIANLYGVDIMDEAVEICKLRLFLKLAAQLESVEQIEPLPDIDFNIRAGNTLIGYTSIADVRKATEATGFDFDDRAGKIEAAAQELDQAFLFFREQQTALLGDISVDHKAELRKRLGVLESQLDRFLAKDYGVDASDDLAASARFTTWKASHKPFHWLIEFYGIINSGGFDVVVGNPPYLEYAKVRTDYTVRNYSTIDCSNLYGFFSERSGDLLNHAGWTSSIVPLSMFATPNMAPVMSYVGERYNTEWASFYSNRPDQLFEGAQNFLAIHVATSTLQENRKYTTYLRRWHSSIRDQLFDMTQYVEIDPKATYPAYSYPKFQSEFDNSIWLKMSRLKKKVSDFASHQFSHGEKAVYCYGGVYWTKARTFDSPVTRNGVTATSTADRPFKMREGASPVAAVAILNSTTHFWFWTNFSDCRNKTYSVMLDMPILQDLFSDQQMIDLGLRLMADYQKNGERKVRDGRNTTIFTEFYPKRSKEIIDKIDRCIGQKMGLTELEMDYLRNFDVKFRMGADDEDVE